MNKGIILAAASTAVMMAGLTGCAKKPGQDRLDPYERYNRAVYAFNTDIDRLFVRPVAKVYSTITPPPLQKGVTNALINVGVISTIPNDLLQGKIKWSLVDTTRLLINSSFGIGGLFDVATRIGIPKHYEDFGMTLSTWSGGKPDPYFILPILGPNTTSSALGMGVDYLMSPWPYIQPRSITWYTFGVAYISVRARLLDADRFVDHAFDPYVFVRDAYLQIRNKMISDNALPYCSAAERAHLPANATATQDAPNIGAAGLYGTDKWNDNTQAYPENEITPPPADFDFDTGEPVKIKPAKPTKAIKKATAA